MKDIPIINIFKHFYLSPKIKKFFRFERRMTDIQFRVISSSFIIVYKCGRLHKIENFTDRPNDIKNFKSLNFLAHKNIMIIIIIAHY